MATKLTMATRIMGFARSFVGLTAEVTLLVGAKAGENEENAHSLRG